MKSIKPTFFILGILLGFSFSGISQTKKTSLNPSLNISDSRVQGLDGAYSVVIIDENGKPQQFNAKFSKGVITSIVINGEPLPEKNWKENEKLISEYVEHLASADNTKNLKYSEFYELETDLRQDLKKLESTIYDLEISKRFEKFYNEELKVWMDKLELELNKSDLMHELDKVLNDLNKELDKFLEERKLYSSEKDKEAYKK